MDYASKTASMILDILTNDITEENNHKKIDNSNSRFMPVVVEHVGNANNGDFISIAHYYEQNGDLMADPEIVFWRKKNECPSHFPSKFVYFPISYRQDGLGINRELVIFENGKPVRFNIKLKNDTTKFVTMWMLNIKDQQNL